MISVFKAVYLDKLKLNFACIGGYAKTPLGMISFIENLLMAIMSVLIFIKLQINKFSIIEYYILRMMFVIIMASKKILNKRNFFKLLNFFWNSFWLIKWNKGNFGFINL